MVLPSQRQRQLLVYFQTASCGRSGCIAVFLAEFQVVILSPERRSFARLPHSDIVSVFIWTQCCCVCVFASRPRPWLGVWCFSHCLSLVSLLQPDLVILLSDLIYSHFCCHRLIFFPPFVSFFLSCPPSPHTVSPLPSPLLLTPLSVLVSLLSATVSQRHCQTGGGVERWRAPGNPRGAFQWEGPQVKISTAAPAEISGCNLHRAVNIYFKPPVFSKLTCQNIQSIIWNDRFRKKITTFHYTLLFLTWKLILCQLLFYL